MRQFNIMQIVQKKKINFTHSNPVTSKACPYGLHTNICFKIKNTTMNMPMSYYSEILFNN